MANIFIPSLYGFDVAEVGPGISGFSIQVHITAKCDQSCKHCYMYNSPLYKSQIESPLSFQDMKNLIKEYFSILDEFNCSGAMVAFTGGDPILSPYFWDIIEYTRSVGRQETTISVMGNPYHIYYKEAKRLKELGVNAYQISIDGLEHTHDSLRKDGSFADSIRALKILHECGITSVAAMTISKLNYQDLIPLYDYLTELEFVDVFGFDRMIPLGNGKNIYNEIFSPDEFRELLFKVYKHEIFKDSRLRITKKEQLWKLLLFELGLVDPIKNPAKERFRSGCFAGTQTVSILADGQILPCRKLELVAGKYPDNSLKDIFLYNEVTKMLRQYDKYENCVNCSANIVCKGCPAMKYAVTGNCYAKEPYCWR